ncbi:alpha/beta hydrolase [Oscillatoriales cyanobacterium LEGE 11467]|uniref:Alpha/beta hydrolase n=1 Tax=Zarconia navalis LEGE 11467 TaxID=1828826 RepID=A0A928Z6U9_9CYAN|nr:alpha/beta hydrolase [Zarconia navalis]MBE9039895.1 alpha/beta hydrolase [Zarconia navalis LEGE 11467]
MSLKSISISPQTDRPPIGLVILLHGWGANARDLAGLVPMLELPKYQFMCPDAPFSHPHVPGGKMWYDLEKEDPSGLEKSRQYLQEWSMSVISQTGVTVNRTLLCGFSQGGAMTLDVGCTQPFAGLFSMSGYLHSQIQPQNQTFPPIAIAHGKQDPVVPLSAAIEARTRLLELGATEEYREYNMGHEICPDEITFLRDFARKVLPEA